VSVVDWENFLLGGGEGRKEERGLDVHVPRHHLGGGIVVVLEQFEFCKRVRQPHTLFLSSIPLRLQFSTSLPKLALQPANLDPKRLARAPKLLSEVVQLRMAFLKSLERRRPASVLFGELAVRSVRSDSSGV
jgi:hypothetical protein